MKLWTVVLALVLLAMLLPLALAMAMAAEPIDRISSAEKMGDHFVFASVYGTGPWHLQISAPLRPEEKSISYQDLEVRAFDAGGNPLPTHPKSPALKVWMSVGGAGSTRQSFGLYTVDKAPNGGEPARVEVKISGVTKVLEFRDRPASSPN